MNHESIIFSLAQFESSTLICVYKQWEASNQEWEGNKQQSDNKVIINSSANAITRINAGKVCFCKPDMFKVKNSFMMQLYVGKSFLCNDNTVFTNQLS